MALPRLRRRGLAARDAVALHGRARDGAALPRDRRHRPRRAARPAAPVRLALQRPDRAGVEAVLVRAGGIRSGKGDRLRNGNVLVKKNDWERVRHDQAKEARKLNDSRAFSTS